MNEITTSDYEHIKRMNTEIKWWAAHTKVNGYGDNAEIERGRVLPSYLLTAYVQNLFESYWGYDIFYQQYARGGIGAKTTKKLIIDTLNEIAEAVMQPNFEDMELRMTILRMYHDAGYQTASQVKLEL